MDSWYILLNDLDDIFFDETTKGAPPDASLRLRDVGSKEWNLMAADVPLPAAIIREAAPDHNSHWMQRFVAKRNVDIAPM